MASLKDGGLYPLFIGIWQKTLRRILAFRQVFGVYGAKSAAEGHFFL